MVVIVDKVVGLFTKKTSSGTTTTTSTDHRPDHLQRMRNVFAAPLDVARDFTAPLVHKTDEQRQFLQAALKDHFVFTHLTAEETKRMINAMQSKSVKKNTTIIQQGDTGDYLYVIDSGTVRFMVDGKFVGEASRGEVMGELALLYDCPRAATVLAKTDCELWRLSQYTFRQIKAAYALQNDHETRSTIRNIPFLKDLPDEYIYKLADSLFQSNFKKGDVLASKGQEIHELTIVKHGFLRATDISIGSTEYANVRLGPGEYFGEGAIVTGNPAIGTVVAETDGTIWTLTKERFYHTLGHLNLDEMMLKSQESKYLSAIPLFAYSDIDSVEFELMASKIEDSEYSKGSQIAKKGYSVTPALYLVRSGAVQLSDGTTTRLLKQGELFGFGQETLLMTNEIKDQNLNFKQDGFVALVAQAAGYIGEMTLKANTVPAQHDVIVEEDAKVGKLTFESIASVIYDINRLGKPGTALDDSVTKNCLEKFRILGAGTFGQVWLTRDKNTNKAYAMKIQYKRELIKFGQAKGVIREKRIMERMKHPFVMNIVNAEQDVDCLYMVMNLLQGGELRSVMRTKKRSHLDERSARFYVAGILEGLSYMHRRRFVYRDLKGENVLLDQNGYCVIVDLGFAKFVPDKTFTFCGTPLFIAPEVILQKGHDKSADVWSLGVLIYEMLTGTNPFYTEEMDQRTLFKRIVSGKWSFPENSSLSPAAKDIIKKLLVVNPQERLGCLARADLDLRDHAWLKSFDFCKLYNKELAAPWVPQVRDPLDGSNFSRWDHLEGKERDLKPLSKDEQQLFKDF